MSRIIKSGSRCVSIYLEFEYLETIMKHHLSKITKEMKELEREIFEEIFNER